MEGMNNGLPCGGAAVCKSAMCRTQEGRFYGLRAKIGVWGSENIGHSQVSGACIAAFSQQAEGVNTFEVGFHVFPELYNNSDVHFYTFWTRDAYSKTGCYNLRCPGFVPASGAALYPGQAVAPTSSYNGEDRYIIISLHTDPDTGDWVVYRDDLDTPSFLGHFPRDLCPDMTGSASRVAWSGFVSYPKNGRGPPMGSGHFAEEGDRRAAYFKNMKLFDSKGHAQDPVPSSLECMADRLECYDRSLVYLAVKDGYLFYYGGPAGCVG
ncbi:uncharacterized protein LOC102717464 [Oryza brachyantha]|uniref:uncharacterized protein LOC102717464 n=1 Tax=Oryza brachyantha TaxID=4533 RepID=UPI0003EAAEC7|nr:uncharacterized protein LOC102717464 [Oryza brachyantha]